jgi:membrane fusion protein (multidrug efflux system)
VTFAVSEQEYLRLSKQRKPTDPVPPLELILADGTVHPHQGRFAFTGREVSQGTGAIEATGLFPNPGNILRPGQYGKVRVPVETLHNVLLVPQQAVSELQGSFQVAIVDRNNAVNIQAIKVGDQIGSSWLILDGLNPGDRVIVDGIQKVTTGLRVNPKASPKKSGG